MEQTAKEQVQELIQEIGELEVLIAQTFQAPDSVDTNWARMLFLYRVQQCQAQLGTLTLGNSKADESRCPGIPQGMC